MDVSIWGCQVVVMFGPFGRIALWNTEHKCDNPYKGVACDNVIECNWIKSETIICLHTIPSWQGVDLDLKKSNQGSVLEAGSLLPIMEILPPAQSPGLYTRLKSLQRLKVRKKPPWEVHFLFSDNERRKIYMRRTIWYVSEACKQTGSGWSSSGQGGLTPGWHVPGSIPIAHSLQDALLLLASLWQVALGNLLKGVNGVLMCMLSTFLPRCVLRRKSSRLPCVFITATQTWTTRRSRTCEGSQWANHWCPNWTSTNLASLGPPLQTVPPSTLQRLPCMQRTLAKTFQPRRRLLSAQRWQPPIIHRRPGSSRGHTPQPLRESIYQRRMLSWWSVPHNLLSPVKAWPKVT